MASSFWEEDAYGTHFFCALCGGPFARVTITTDEESVPSSGSSLFQDTIQTLDNTPLDARAIQSNLESIYPLNLDLENHKLWINSTITRKAYSGTKLERQNYKWTRVLRALINKHAKVQPEGGLAQLDFNQQTYLSGRGKVREDGSWADAYASVESEPDSDDEDATGLPRYNENCGFHLYQEPDRDDRKLRISSIPFHDECWNILDHAFQMARARRGIRVSLDSQSQSDNEDEHIDTDELWSYLNELIPISDTENVADLTTESIRTGSVSYVITRLSKEAMGNGGYLAAESSAGGMHWLHQDDLHWLVADPSVTSFLRDPLKLPSENEGSNKSPVDERIVGGRIGLDPFSKLPHEVLVETIRYLTCLETFRWRVASPTVNQVTISQGIYRRFIREEMEYLPKLFQQTETIKHTEDGKNIDWKQVFENVSAAHRHDDSLRNRRRIWKILQPIAEEVVERSDEHMMHLQGAADDSLPAVITVVRGKLGTRSEAEGDTQSTLFFFQYPNPNDIRMLSIDHLPSFMDTQKGFRIQPSAAVTNVHQIIVWLDPDTRHLRGFELVFRFHLPPNMKIPRLYNRRLGCQTTHQETYMVETYGQGALTGIIASWADGHVTGISFTLEDVSDQPDEFNRKEIQTPRYGVWKNGGIRRLVSPRKYRIFAGISAFINSAGFFETLAIFEQSKIVHDAEEGSLVFPPKSVALSHQEASIWTQDPPRDLVIHDREGPPVGYWRLKSSQWILTSSTPSHGLSGRLQSIVAYTNGEYLAGLRFWFQDRHHRRRRSSQELGNCMGTNLFKVEIAIDESISVATIGHSSRGIHSLQLLLSSGTVTPVFGSRYKGNHSVYAIEGSMFPGRERLGRCHFLKLPIIGFHSLYEEKINRIIQLGVMTVHPKATLLSNPISSKHMSLLDTASPASSKSISIPFIETDEYRSPWVGFMPPSYLVRASKRSDSSSLAAAEFQSDFAGWVSFHNSIKAITVFGHMEGISFVFWNDEPDIHFGNTSEDLKTEVQRFRREHSRISCITTLKSPQGLSNLKFFDQSHAKSRSCFVEIESKTLTGIKFNFTSSRLTHWYPLVDSREMAGDDISLVIAGQSSQLQDCTPTSNLFGYYRTVFSSLESSDSGARVDGVRGYSKDGVFCGLRIRRNGLWDFEPLGVITAYQVEFLLDQSEQIQGIYQDGSAVALYTNSGRTTPWIGDPSPGAEIERICSLPNSRPVGVTITYSDPSRWKKVGFLCKTNRSSRALQVDDNPTIPAPPIVLRCDLDPTSQYKWRIDPATIMQTLTFHPLELEFGNLDIEPRPEKAYTLFDPDHLTGIEAYVNDVPGRFGLKAMKFQGGPYMGETRLGDWHDQFAAPLPAQRVTIEGANGERIISMKLDFLRHKRGDRIIGLTIYTNWKREHDIVAWRSITTEKPTKAKTFSRTTPEIDSRTRICGFHYVIGVYIHDIQIVTSLDA